MKKLILTVTVLAAALTGLSSPALAAGSADPDRDGVDTRNERRQGTDPRVRDSDRDGRSDGREDADRDGLSNATEDATGNDPVARDSDDDGVADGREGAGVVTSFAGGILTVRLASGGTATAVVDGFTDVRCPTERGYERGQHGAAKALRRSGRKGRSGPKRSARRGARDAGRVHARPAQEPDEEFEDEVGVEEGWSDEIEWTEEDGSGDEEVGDDSGEEWSEEDWGGESTSACLGSVKRGTPVHASAVDSDAEGSWFVAVALVR